MSLMTTELKEGLTRVSSDLLGSLRMVWQSISQVPSPALAEGGLSSMTPTEEAEGIEIHFYYSDIYKNPLQILNVPSHI